MRAHDILYFVGFVCYIFAIGLIIFGIALFFVPAQASQSLSTTENLFVQAFAYGSGIYALFSALGIFVSGAMFVAFADLVRSNIRSEESLLEMVDKLDRSRRR